MTGFSMRFRASRVSLGALLAIIFVLVGAIGLVVFEAGNQLRIDGSPWADIGEIRASKAGVETMPLARPFHRAI